MSKLNKLYQTIKRHVRKILAGVTMVGAVALGPPLYVISQDFLRREELEKELTRLENTLSDTYNVEIGVWREPSSRDDRPPQIRKTSLRSHSPYMSLKALEGLEKTMQNYPRKLLQDNMHGVEIVRAYLESAGTEDILKQGATPLAYTSWWGGMSISVGIKDWLRYHRA